MAPTVKTFHGRPKVLIAIQARSASTRLRGKIFKLINGKSILERIYETARSVHEGTLVIGPENDVDLIQFCAKKKIPLRLGDPENLVHRYLRAIRLTKSDYLVRLTADCPFVSADLLRYTIRELVSNEYDYVSNTFFRTFPEGYDIQACSMAGFRWFLKSGDVEHPFHGFDMNLNMRDQFAKDGLTYACILWKKRSDLLKAWSVDTEEDLRRLRRESKKPGSKLGRKIVECTRTGVSGDEFQTMVTVR